VEWSDNKMPIIFGYCDANICSYQTSAGTSSGNVYQPNSATNALLAECADACRDGYSMCEGYMKGEKWTVPQFTDKATATTADKHLCGWNPSDSPQGFLPGCVAKNKPACVMEDGECAPSANYENDRKLDWSCIGQTTSAAHVDKDVFKNGILFNGGPTRPTRYNLFPNMVLDYDTRVECLRKAQTSYLFSIIVVQWADLIICKTRQVSLFEHGMSNWVMNTGLMEETFLGLAICYFGFLNAAFESSAVEPSDLCWALPFSLFIFVYDEIRKKTMRYTGGKNKTGFLYEYTYW